MKKTNETGKSREKYLGKYYTCQFATTLRSLLDNKEFSQEKIANELNITRQTISLYANGNSLPDINRLKQIITYFRNHGYDYSSDYWIGLINEPSTDIEAKTISKKYGLTKLSLDNLENATENGYSEYLNIMLDNHYNVRDNVVNLARYRCLYSLFFIDMKNIRDNIFRKLDIEQLKQSLNTCVKKITPFDEFELIFIINNMISILENKASKEKIITEYNHIETLLKDRLLVIEYTLKEIPRHYISRVTKETRNEAMKDLKVTLEDYLENEANNNEHKGNRKK